MLTTEMSESSAPFRLEQRGDRWVTVCAECERVARVHMGAARPDSAALALGASRRQHQSWCGSHEAKICTPEVAAEVANSIRLDAAARAAGYAGANVYRGTYERCQTAVEARAGGFLRAGRRTQVFHLDPAFCAAEVARLRELRSTRIPAPAAAPPAPPTPQPAPLPAPATPSQADDSAARFAMLELD